jgi:hypothetical protein
MKHINQLALIAVGFLAGVAASWVYVRNHVLSLPALDRPGYKYVCIDFGPTPLLVLHGEATNRTYAIGSPGKPQILTRSQFHDFIAKLVAVDSTQTFCICVDSNVPIADVQGALSDTKAHGADNVRVLLESPQTVQNPELETRYQEITFGPSMDLLEYQYEWFVDYQIRHSTPKKK